MSMSGRRWCKEVTLNTWVRLHAFCSIFLPLLRLKVEALIGPVVILITFGLGLYENYLNALDYVYI